MIPRHSNFIDEFGASVIAKEGTIKTAREVKRSEPTSAELLYGLKPDGDVDIIDLAHPTPVVIAPSHDKVNGLVENIKERQKIMVQIALKPTNGRQTAHIYAAAHEDLLDEVIRLGFLLDSKEQLDLMALADDCAARLSDRTVKEAALPLLPIIGIIGAGVAALSLMNNFGEKIDSGVVGNCTRAIKQLQEVIESEEQKGLHPQIAQMIKNISYVKALGEKADGMSVPKPSINNAMSPEAKQATDLLDEYADACQLLGKYLTPYIKLLKYAPEETSSNSWLAGLEKVWEYIYPAEIKDAVTSLETLQKSLFESVSKIEERKSAVKSYIEANKDDISVQLGNKQTVEDDEMKSIEEQLKK